MSNVAPLGARRHRRKLQEYGCAALLALTVIRIIFAPEPAVADDTGSGAATAQTACDMAPYEAHLQTTLQQRAAAALQFQGILFMRLANDGRDHNGVVVFGIGPDGHVMDAKIQKSTGSPGLDTLVLSAVKRTDFGPPPACFPRQVLPIKFQFDIPNN